ncbi:ABC transporter permease subunit [Vreelandella arcis]|uniref:Phosphate transport system permease protein n=1 Tax=Vreelandella arcis TaxID=416873 RepID=A0A1G9X3V0_9GAMM|nr:ABC transporter permease subunit [Halomonas arcis]SDM91429.1 phosphate transport system permease protein [Halomonas arcis]
MTRNRLTSQPFRHLQDRIATGLITAGGMGVLLAVLGIGVFLVWEAMPLLLSGNTNALTRLSPLAWGTLKAALMALLFALPLALGAAFYSGFFMSRQLHSRIKPTLEMMEAIPGVVIGFIAGLIFAPWVERHLASTLVLLIWLPLSMGLAGLLWHLASRRWQRRLPLSWAALWLIPWLIAMFMVALWLTPLVEQAWWGGDLRQRLYLWFGLDYVTRNALIVGLAMGFAVIPSIYSLAEDALTEVPRSLMEGAQALGASRWQAAMKVALPAAWPGLFSATMIGAGRAVGETMIVLLASSNTALLSASPFEGMRTMAAAIAIELPEASAGGTPYRMLVLAALVLFLFTFLVNTLAEVVRQRLRRRYHRIGGAS